MKDEIKRDVVNDETLQNPESNDTGYGMDSPFDNPGEDFDFKTWGEDIDLKNLGELPREDCAKLRRWIIEAVIETSDLSEEEIAWLQSEEFWALCDEKAKERKKLKKNPLTKN